MKKIKQIFFNCCLFIAAICFMFALGEIVVRTAFIEPDKTEWIGNPKTFYEYHDFLGWRNIPNTDAIRTIHAKGKNKVTYKINSRGIRGPEYSYEKPENEYRILFLGDSYTEGYVVDFEDLFSELLKERLNGLVGDKYVQTINSGTSGWSTDQELLFFQHEGKKYNPDLTVLMFYENDLAYNNQPKDFGMFYKPMFKEVKGELVLTNVPVPRPDRIINNTQLADYQNASLIKKLKLWLHKTSFLYGFIKKRIKSTHVLHRLLLKLNLEDVPQGKDALLTREFNVWEKTYNESVRNSWHITEAMIVKLKEETEASGSDMLIFFVPHEAGVYREMWKKIKN